MITQVAALTTDLPPASTVGLLVPVGTNIYPGIFEDIKAKFPAAFAVLEIYGQSEGGCAVSICMGQGGNSIGFLDRLKMGEGLKMSEFGLSMS